MRHRAKRSALSGELRWDACPPLSRPRVGDVCLTVAFSGHIEEATPVAEPECQGAVVVDVRLDLPVGHHGAASGSRRIG